ncbi:hypothetical protein ACLB1Q_23370 [Escherichia coli]
MLDGHAGQTRPGLRYTLSSICYLLVSYPLKKNPQHLANPSHICSGLQHEIQRAFYQWILIDLPRDASGTQPTSC